MKRGPPGRLAEKEDAMDKMNAITRSLTDSAALFLMLVTAFLGGDEAYV